MAGTVTLHPELPFTAEDRTEAYGLLRQGHTVTYVRQWFGCTLEQLRRECPEAFDGSRRYA